MQERLGDSSDTMILKDSFQQCSATSRTTIINADKLPVFLLTLISPHGLLIFPNNLYKLWITLTYLWKTGFFWGQFGGRLISYLCRLFPQSGWNVAGYPIYGGDRGQFWKISAISPNPPHHSTYRLSPLCPQMVEQGPVYISGMIGRITHEPATYGGQAKLSTFPQALLRLLNKNTIGVIYLCIYLFRKGQYASEKNIRALITTRGNAGAEKA